MNDHALRGATHAVVFLKEYTEEDEDVAEGFKRQSKHDFLTNCFWFAYMNDINAIKGKALREATCAAMLQ